MILTGCMTPRPIVLPEDARLMICKDANEKQKEAWDRVVKLASIDGDLLRIAAGVEWAGGHIWRCRK